MGAAHAEELATSAHLQFSLDRAGVHQHLLAPEQRSCGRLHGLHLSRRPGRPFASRFAWFHPIRRLSPLSSSRPWGFTSEKENVSTRPHLAGEWRMATHPQCPQNLHRHAGRMGQKFSKWALTYRPSCATDRLSVGWVLPRLGRVSVGGDICRCGGITLPTDSGSLGRGGERRYGVAGNMRVEAIPDA